MAIGSIMNAVMSSRKADAARKDKESAQDRLNVLYGQRPQYNADELAKQSVNKLYDSNINLYDAGSKSSILAGQGSMQNQVDANSANAQANAMRSGVSSPSQYSSILTSSLQAQNDAQTKMGIAGAQQRLDYKDKLVGANTDKAEEQDKAWNQNIWLPYNEKKEVAYNDVLSNSNDEKAWEAQKQKSTAQVAQDVGNFFKSIYSGGKAKQNDIEAPDTSVSSSKNNASMDKVNARGQGVSKSWQERGRGFTKM